MPIQAIAPGAALAATTLTFRCQNPACPQTMQPQNWTTLQVAAQVHVALSPPQITLTCPLCGAIEYLTLTLDATQGDAATSGNYPDRAVWAWGVRTLMRVVGMTPP